MEQPRVTARNFASIISYYSKQQDSEKTQCEGLHILYHFSDIPSPYAQPLSQTIKGKEVAV